MREGIRGGGGVTNSSANGSEESMIGLGAACWLKVEKMSSIAWASGPSSMDTSIPGCTNGEAFDIGFDCW